jgi:hypothetical protein
VREQAGASNASQEDGMNKFEPHWEVLPPEQREIWPQLAATLEMGFVLYGGTAVALRLGHRTSVDFDFFTEKPLDRESLERGFPFLGYSRILQDRKDTLTVLAPAGKASVKVSFFGGIDVGRAGVPDRTPDGVAEVASLLDLLATKLKVLQQRIEAKDYRDVAAILRTEVGLDEGLAAASALYGLSFQPSEAVKALTWFEGGDLETLPQADKELLARATAKVGRTPVAGSVSHFLSSQSH